MVDFSQKILISVKVLLKTKYFMKEIRIDFLEIGKKNFQFSCEKLL